MIKYTDVYKWEVIDRLILGEAVFALDRDECKVYNLREISASELIGIMRGAKHDEDNDRYTFWVAEHVEESEESAE